MPPDFRMRVTKGCFQKSRAQLVQSVESAKGMKTSFGGSMGFRHLNQCLGCGNLFSLHQQPVGHVPDDSIAFRKTRHEFLGGRLVQSGNAARRFPVLVHPINSTVFHTRALERFHFGFATGREPLGMLDHVAVHVDDPEGSVRPGACHDRPAPAIFRGKEIQVILGFRPFGGETFSIALEDHTLHQVVKGLAGESINVFVREEVIVPVDRGRTSAGEATGLIEVVKAFLGWSGGKDERVTFGQDASRIRRSEIRIPGKVAMFQYVVPERKAILDTEPISPVIT